MARLKEVMEWVSSSIFIPRSRGSTHRSYWRAEGPCSLIRLSIQFISTPITSNMNPTAPMVQAMSVIRVYKKPIASAGGYVICSLANLVTNTCKSYMCGFNWFSLFGLSLVYLYKKGVNFVIENPTTSLLFRYKPLKDPWNQLSYLILVQVFLRQLRLFPYMFIDPRSC